MAEAGSIRLYGQSCCVHGHVHAHFLGGCCSPLWLTQEGYNDGINYWSGGTLDRRERVKDKVKKSSERCAGGWNPDKPAAVSTVVVAQTVQ